jgi:lincosamide nucleotidyltransferase A/C/D/E
MAAQEVVRLLDLLESAGVTVWLDGGWGVDALLEEQTREHDDLGLVARIRGGAALD